MPDKLALARINAADDLLSQAIKAKSIRIASRNSQIFEKHSAHPYPLVTPQNVTDLVLGQKLQSLGVPVQRPYRVVGMKQSEKDPRITDVYFEDGQVIKARYIIDADGAHSVTRTIAGIGFSDPEGPNRVDHVLAQMVAADVTFEPEPVGSLTLKGHLNGTISSDSFFMLMLFGNHFNAELTRDGNPTRNSIFRVSCAIPAKNGKPPHAPTKEYIQNVINTYGPAYRPAGLVFKTHSAIAGRTFTRLGAAIFLVGDAAHVHSPAGGQGMNLSIRDAIFLAEAVTKHIKASAENPDVDDTTLQEFAEARRAGNHRPHQEIPETRKPYVHMLGGCRSAGPLSAI
ncbi:hypothetical protein DEU56DRAFT_920904 [Suillus clintonianus]|uniref:uncharacterized protein n=1 Tax=Suillus clintonianus TaxID=1904413 RepID=UPI001B88413E|nr:uncharacterized protein DEU56DRAFT_920904 [Suillus clintonianus]KAG2157096.1 hypothetical protein DEU56DRAFT_920904 [Suillus clintonianus]